MSDEVQKLGIKETQEIFEGVKPLVVAGVKIGADGKVGVEDLEHLLNLSKQLDVILAGVKGADQALKELKDLDQQEMLQLVGSVYSLVTAIKEARKA